MQSDTICVSLKKSRFTKKQSVQNKAKPKNDINKKLRISQFLFIMFGMTKMIGDPVRLPRVTDGPVQQVIRIGQAGHDERVADIIIDGQMIEATKIASVVRAGFYRAAHVSSAIDKSLIDQLSVAIVATGTTIMVVDRLWSGVAPPYRAAKVMRGGLTQAAHNICASLAAWRTLWRVNGAAAILEWPTGADPWLRPLDLAEIEMMIDQMGIEADNGAGEAGYLLNRVAHAVMAHLPSWLPPASGVSWAGPENMAGYNRRTEAISLVKPVG